MGLSFGTIYEVAGNNYDESGLWYQRQKGENGFARINEILTNPVWGVMN